MSWFRYLRKIRYITALLGDVVDLLEETMLALSDRKISDKELLGLKAKTMVLLNKIKVLR